MPSLPSLPTPLKAAIGLAATAVDRGVEQVRGLPAKALELPMTALSTALQVSLRAQQRYSQFAVRGEAVLHRAPVTDAPPSWASFEPDLDDTPFDDGPFDDADAAAVLLDALGVGADPADGPGASDEPEDNRAAGRAERAADRPLADVVQLDEPDRSRPARKTTPRKAPAKTARKTAPKTVRAPRNTPPSKFDSATFEDDDE